MTLSIWRWAHLALALVSGLFLIVLSVTGVILAIGAVETDAYRVDKEISLAETLPTLTQVYPEISELTVDHRGFAALQALDAEGNAIHAWINPQTGKIYESVKNPSDFIQWNTALHRSLFLKETGRILVGVVSFLLLVIAITGVVLIVKRQQGLRNFFSKINKDYFWSYFHVVSGRITLIPVIILALTGTYLFMARIGLTPGEETVITAEAKGTPVSMDQFPLFNTLKLAEVEKIEFPFLPDDPEEHFVIHLKDRKLQVSQITGEVVEEVRYPITTVWEKVSLDLHTGRTNAIWAIILAIASLNILFFIYSGLAITLRRKKAKVKNTVKPEKAEYLILVGSENGSTLNFAVKVQEQMLQAGLSAYIMEMDRWQPLPMVKHLLVFTSTYGLGTAPANASKFIEKLESQPLTQFATFTVVGFGSKAYPDFCAFAEKVDQCLTYQSWAKRGLKMHTVNDRSLEDFVAWVKEWNRVYGMELGITPALYAPENPKLSTFKVVDNSGTEPTFMVRLESKKAFRSGDLLAIYPQNKERLYSIGKVGNTLQLVVKRHENGLGSTLLSQLAAGGELEAKIIANPNFHFPRKAKEIILIANGTGIAPFLGMIEENVEGVPLHLYVGFRYKTDFTKAYETTLDAAQKAGRLSSYRFAYSRDENYSYVMDLILQDAGKFVQAIQNGGVIMLCGSLAMQRDVEKMLEEILGELPSGQIRSDCY
jgi:sulfite reductase (NADPH) flavoprotein alpha-component